MPLALGTVVADRYELIRTIKSGGMGAVYEVRDLAAPGPSLALKEMLEGFADDEEALVRRRFEEEARMLARLSHPGIPAISDFFFRDRFGCIVMEFIRGEDLEHELQDYLALTHRPFPAESLVKDVLEILDVLAYLHGQAPPVVHRDLKPANLIRDWETGRVRLVDFGLARFVREGGMTSQTLVGTLGYCPLEQMQGHSEPRSDLYALGATMHHLLSGKAPKFLDLPPLAEVAPFVDPGLCVLVDRAAAMEAGERFATAADMAAALQGWLRGREAQEAPPTVALPTPAPPPEAEPEIVAEEPVSRGVPGVPVAVGAAVILVGLGVFLLPRGQATSTVPTPSPRRVALAVTPTPSPSPAARVPAAPPTLPPLQRPDPSPSPPRPRPSPRVERHPEVAVQPDYPRTAPTRPAPARTPEPPPSVQTLPPVETPPDLPALSAPPPLSLGLDRPPDEVVTWGSPVNMEDPERSLRVWFVEVPQSAEAVQVVQAAAAEIRQSGWDVGRPDRRPSGIVVMPTRRGDRRGVLLLTYRPVPNRGPRLVVGHGEVADGSRAPLWLQRLEERFDDGPGPPGGPR